MKTVSRSAGRSTTAAAAYRAGVNIVDRRTGEVHDFTRKGGVLGAAVVLPGGGTMPRAELWNGIEEHHKRKDAVLAREIEVALPSELSDNDRERIALDYARELADRYGVGVDIALHAPSRDGDERNHHAHIMLTACYASPSGELGKKAVELDPIHCQRHKLPNAVEHERERWADLVNTALAERDIDARIDHRSHAERGLDELPGYHLGPQATAIVRRGERSTIVEREQARRDAARNQAQADLDAARKELAQANAEVKRTEREAVPVEALETPLERKIRLMQADLWSDLKKPAKASKNALQPHERAQRIAELAEQITKLEREASRPVGQLVESVRSVREATLRLYELRQKTAKAKALREKAQRDAQEWREKHPVRARLHDAGMKRDDTLTQFSQVESKMSAGLDKLATAEKAAQQDGEKARDVARLNIKEHQRGQRSELDQLRTEHAGLVSEQEALKLAQAPTKPAPERAMPSRDSGPEFGR